MQKIILTYRNPSGYALDNRWITVFPNGAGHKGRHVEIDDNGNILNGMGGTHNGENIRSLRNRKIEKLPQGSKGAITKRVPIGAKGKTTAKVKNGEYQHVKETLEKAGIVLSGIHGYHAVGTPVKTKTGRISRYRDGTIKTTPKYGYVDVDERCTIAASNQLLKLSNKFDVVGKPSQLRFAIAPLSTTKAGCFTPRYELIEINSKFCASKDQFVERQRSLCASGVNMPCSEGNLKNYAITHEFGNFIQYQLVARELGKSVDGMENEEILNEMAKRASTYKKQILEIAGKICDEQGKTAYNWREDISESGKKKATEFFAECFANSQCGKPTILGKAMNRWLKRKGLVRKRH